MCVNPASPFPGPSLVVVSEGRSTLYNKYDEPFPSPGGVSEGRGGQNDYRRTKNSPTEDRGGQNAYLKSLGLTVIHIRVEDVFNRLHEVMEELKAHLALQ